MALTKLIANVENVSLLSDLPNDQDGLTAAQLKAVFDLGNVLIKSYINDTLTEQIDSQFSVRSFHTGGGNLSPGQTSWSVTLSGYGIKGNSFVYVKPHEGHEHMWNSCGIRCTAQTNNALSFVAATAPTATVAFDVFVLNN